MIRYADPATGVLTILFVLSLVLVISIVVFAVAYVLLYPHDTRKDKQ